MNGLRLKTVASFAMRQGICWALATAWSTAAWAQGLGSLPMTYSGRLTESSGAPKDGPVDIVATFWTAEFEGTQLGQSFSFASAVLNQGVFSVQFSFLAPQVQDIFRDGSEPVFIEITAAGKTYPRQKFNFIPLAMRVPVDSKSLSFDTASGKLGIVGAKTAASGSMLVSNGAGGVSWVVANTSGSAGSGSVTSVTTGVGLTGGPITSSGTISLANTGVTAGSYARPNITVDAQGRISGAQSGGLLVDSDIAAGAGIAQSKIQGLVADLSSRVASITAGTGIAVSSTSGTATVSLGPVGTAGTYALVQTNAQGQVVGGSTLSASDIPTLPASKITSGQLSTANGGTGVNSAATFPTSGVVVTREAVETLTNKSLDAAVITGASSIGGTTTINTTGIVTTGALTAATVTSQGNVTVRGDGTIANKLVINDKTNTKYVAFRAPDALSASLTWELPATDGAPGQVLATNGAGTLSWVSGLAPTGVASGDLTGNFPSPSLAAVGTAGNYTKVTTDSKGRVISGATLTTSDLPPISATSLNTGTIAVANGGTGVGAFTNNGVVIGSSSALSSTAAGTQYNVLMVNASNQPTFGTLNLASSNAVNGTLGLTNGGTGATTKSGAFDALSPMISEGDLISGGASGTGTRLAGNTTTTKHFLTSTGTGSAAVAPAWAALTASDIPAHSATLITSGVLNVANGGTGAATTSANYVFAGPTSGSGAPSFRALLAGDYPTMVGANGTVAGTKGAVPGPTATDNAKFLRGDGTWATPDPAAAGASNQIQYNSGGVLTGNNGFVYVGGNVGIGTTNPNGILDVRPPNVGAGAGGSIFLYAQSPGSNNNNGGSIILMTGTHTGTGTSGKVGIGTTNPAGYFDLRPPNIDGEGGSIFIYGQSPLSNNHSGGNIILVPGMATGTGTVGRIGFNTTTPQSLLDIAGSVSVGAYAGVNAAPANGIIVSGNIGVGTTTTAAKLDVNGTIKISGGTPGAGKVLTSDANGLASWTTPVSGTVSSVGITAPAAGITVASGSPVTSSGSITLALANDLSAVESLATTGLAKRTANDTWTTVTDNSTNWDAAYTDRLKWDGGATGLVAATGRTSLGLGGLATLSAVGSTEITDGTIVNADISASASIADSKLATISTAGKVSGSAITSGTIGGTTAISTSGTITTSGNVGIGTTAPAVTLDLQSRTDALALPSGTSAQQPASPVAGWIRYNSTNSNVEYFNGSIWASASNAVSPAGMVGSFPMGTCPTGWLEANGAAVSRSTYASLFVAINTMYGAGDGSTTFNLPDYRGYFLRGWNHGSGNDPEAALRSNRGDATTGDAVGTKQLDALQNITGGFKMAGSSGGMDNATGAFSVTGSTSYPSAFGSSVSGVGPVTFNAAAVARTSTETRSKNINVIYCISTAMIGTVTTANTGSGSVNYIPLWTSTTALGNSPIAVGSGNVGIGTTAPNSLLHVSGTSSAPAIVSEVGIFEITTQGSSASELSIGGATAAPYALWMQGKRINSDGTVFPLALNPLGGNVGIGTIAPTQRLTVSGTIESTSGGIKFPDATTMASALIDPSLTGGRLTLTSGTPVPTTDVTGASAGTLYFTPYMHNRIALWNGTNWQAYAFNELSASLSGIGASQMFDVFIYDSGGTLSLDLVNWTNDTTRAVALTTQDGVKVKSGAPTRRYLGSARTTSTAGQSEDSGNRRLVWNNYHRARRNLKRYETAVSWTYNSSAYRPYANNTANRIEVVMGQNEDAVRVALYAHTGGGITYLSFGLDSTTTPTGLKQAFNQNGGTSLAPTTVEFVRPVGVGYHYVQALESCSGACSFWGVSGGDVQLGIEGDLFN